MFAVKTRKFRRKPALAIMIFMKRIVLYLLFIVLLSSCRSMTYFETPNDFRNMPSTLYLTNGRSYEGKLQVHTNHFSKSAVKLYTEGDKKPMRFSLDHIEGFELRNSYYELKEIKGSVQLLKEFSFMKRLTKENSRIHLYENTRKVNRPGGKHTSSHVSYETEYFLQLPGEANAVWSISSSRFVPNFDEKMSKVLADCPLLAAKIAGKEEGYFYAQVSLFNERRANVLMNIINEYNACGK